MLRAGRTPRELAESLGVSEQTLRNWRRQDRGRSPRARRRPTSDELEELRAAAARERASEAGARSAQTSRGLLRSGERAPVTAYRLISAEKARTPVSMSLPAARRQPLGLLRVGAPTRRRIARSTDAWLIEQIRAIHAAHRGVYGSPRIHAELRMAHGIRVGRKRVERLMRAGRHLRAGAPQARPHHDQRARASASPTTWSSASSARPRPNVLWVADVTYLRTWEGWLYLAAVQDAYSRRDRRLERWPTTCAQSSSSTRCRWPSRAAAPSPG